MSKIKILITAGPTWMKIDRVRILTNIFTGRTGFLIAQAFKKRGFSVKLLLGTSRFKPGRSDLDIVRFRYFEDLRRLLNKELKDKAYKAVIHCAAVSDYRPLRVYKGKIPSQKKTLVLKLMPAPKLIKEIRRQRKDIFLVQFKLEIDKSRKVLIGRAYKSLTDNKSDIVVANDLKNLASLSYKAYIIDKQKNIETVKSSKELADALIKVVRDNFLKCA